MLLDQPNIKVNCQDLEGNTPVMNAVKSSDINTVATMLNACAIPYIANKAGKSLLDLTADLKFPFQQIIQTLIEETMNQWC